MCVLLCICVLLCTCVCYCVYVCYYVHVCVTVYMCVVIYTCMLLHIQVCVLLISVICIALIYFKNVILLMWYTYMAKLLMVGNEWKCIVTMSLYSTCRTLAGSSLLNIPVVHSGHVCSTTVKETTKTL